MSPCFRVPIESGKCVMMDKEGGEDVVDAAVFCKYTKGKPVPSIEALNSEMPGKGSRKEKRKLLIKTLLNRLRLRKCASVTISRPDPTYRVAYLGNVVTGWAKGKGELLLISCTGWLI